MHHVSCQVSSIRKSKTDEKKFYIFTGTKTLNLRALTREDRNAWLDSLLASKDLLSKFPIPHGLLLPYEGKTIPTNKLRCRLVEEGLSDTAVTECENIMKSEFVKLQEQVKYLQQNYLGLIEKLRLIEVGSSTSRKSSFSFRLSRKVQLLETLYFLMFHLMKIISKLMCLLNPYSFSG